MSARSVVVALLACFAAGAQAQDDSRLRELLAQLGAEDASARDAAQAELERLGAADDTGAVERLLADAAHSSDPEVSVRAQAALCGLRYWDRIFLVGGDWGARAVDLEAGTLAWKVPGACDAWVRERKRGAMAFIAPQSGGLSAVDLRTGELRWKLDGHPMQLGHTQDHWLGYEDGALVCASLDTGLLWTRKEKIDIVLPNPLCLQEEGTHLYLNTKGGLIALDAKTGQVSWRSTVRAYSFACAPGAVYLEVWSSNPPGRVQRLDSASGEVCWEWTAPCKDAICGVCMQNLVGDLLLARTEERSYALEIESGRVRWECDHELQCAIPGPQAYLYPHFPGFRWETHRYCSR